MGISENAAAQLIWRARSKLKGALTAGAVASVVATSEDCETAQVLINRLQDGEPITDAQHEWLEDHLEECQKCRAARGMIFEVADLVPAVGARCRAGDDEGRRARRGRQRGRGELDDRARGRGRKRRRRRRRGSRRKRQAARLDRSRWKRRRRKRRWAAQPQRRGQCERSRPREQRRPRHRRRSCERSRPRRAVREAATGCAGGRGCRGHGRGHGRRGRCGDRASATTSPSVKTERGARQGRRAGEEVLVLCAEERREDGRGRQRVALGTHSGPAAIPRQPLVLPNDRHRVGARRGTPGQRAPKQGGTRGDGPRGGPPGDSPPGGGNPAADNPAGLRCPPVQSPGGQPGTPNPPAGHRSTG